MKVKNKGFLYYILYVLAFLTYPIWLILNIIIEWFIATYKKTAIYAVVGRTGSGKSIFKYLLENGNKSDRFYTLTNKKSGNVSNLYEVDLQDLFNDNECKVNFNGSNINLMTFDEIQLDFDNRDFKIDSYKKIFQPFAKFLSLHRHQKVKRVFFFTQSWDNLDSKIRRVCHYVIDIDHTKKIDLPYMILNKKIVRIPNKLKLVVFKKQDYEDNKEYFEQVKKGIFNTKIKFEDLDRYTVPVPRDLLLNFNTFAFEDYYSDKKIFDIKKYVEEKKASRIKKIKESK